MKYFASNQLLTFCILSIIATNVVAQDVNSQTSPVTDPTNNSQKQTALKSVQKTELKITSARPLKFSVAGQTFTTPISIKAPPGKRYTFTPEMSDCYTASPVQVLVEPSPTQMVKLPVSLKSSKVSFNPISAWGVPINADIYVDDVFIYNTRDAHEVELPRCTRYATLKHPEFPSIKQRLKLKDIPVKKTIVFGQDLFDEYVRKRSRNRLFLSVGLGLGAIAVGSFMQANYYHERRTEALSFSVEEARFIDEDIQVAQNRGILLSVLSVVFSSYAISQLWDLKLPELDSDEVYR